MAAQRRGAALGDGRHRLELGQAQMAALHLAPGRAVLAEDVGDPQGGPLHGPCLKKVAASGPITSRSRSVATCA